MTRTRPIVSALAVVILTGALGSCTDQHLTGGPTGSPRKPSLTPPTGPPEGVRFIGSITQGSTSDELIVRYQIVNDGREPVVVFNRVPATDSPNARPAEPENFYVTAQAGNHVQISKQVFGMPEGISVYARMVLGGTTVAPGDRLGERIETSNSFTSRRPYQDVLDHDTARVDEPDGITLCIGVARAGKVSRLEYHEAPHPVYAHDNRTANQQHLFCSERSLSRTP